MLCIKIRLTAACWQKASSKCLSEAGVWDWHTGTAPPLSLNCAARMQMALAAWARAQSLVSDRRRRRADGIWEAPTDPTAQRDPPSLRPLINSFDGRGTKGQGSRQQQGGVGHGDRKARENPVERGGERTRERGPTEEHGERRHMGHGCVGGSDER